MSSSPGRNGPGLIEAEQDERDRIVAGLDLPGETARASLKR